MSILINGLEMPDSCALCPMWDAGNCLVAAEAIICEYTKRPSDCPLVPIPTHGRLIDADALKDLYHHSTHNSDIDTAWICTIRRSIDNAPTIIPAEEEMK